MGGCSHVKAEGTKCRVGAMRGSEWCYGHHPDYAEQRTQNARKGGKAGGRGRPSLARDLADVRQLAQALVRCAAYGSLKPEVLRNLVGIVQALQVYCRLAELEIQVAQQPLEDSLDVAGLKEQVLARVEELEEREAEREAHLKALASLAKEAGLDLPILSGAGRRAQGG